MRHFQKEARAGTLIVALSLLAAGSAVLYQPWPTVAFGATPMELEGGADSAGSGRVLFANYCSVCHTIDGSSQPLIGPDLREVASRPMIADVLANRPENLARLIADQASDVVAYLEFLQAPEPGDDSPSGD